MTNESGFGNLEMAALKKRQAQSAAGLDLMRPGNGTPWEDRGALGAVPAYFSTVIKSLASPALLMDHIRRPETTSDATSFAIVSGAMWMVGILVWNAVYYFHYLPNADFMIDRDNNGPMFFWLTAVGQCAVMGLGLYLWIKIGSNLFRSLGGGELKQATPSLVQNILCYSLGPSLLAVVPFYGWGLAMLWIMIDMMVACKRRLFMKTSSSIINPLIMVICVVVVAVVAYFVLHLIWGVLLRYNGLIPRPTPPDPIHHS